MEFYAFDEAYVRRLQAGDAATQQHFVGYFSQLILIKLRSRRVPPDVIDDVRQETFLRVLSALRKGDGVQQPERFGAYVNSVCGHVLMERYRSSARAQGMEEGFDAPDTTIDLDRALVSEEAQRQVNEVLARMTERDRRLLQAVFLEEADKDQVCHEYGVERGYLRVLLHRAKAQFRSLLAQPKPVGAGR